jgi:hypothetical protein
MMIYVVISKFEVNAGVFECHFDFDEWHSEKRHFTECAY